MIAYLIKSGLCLTLLLVIYHLFLEREKMHQFNRYFLIFGLVFGLFTPLLTLNFGIETSIPTTNFQATNIGSSLTSIDTSATAEPQKEWPIQEIMIALYGLGFSFFLFRFSRGIYAIFHRVGHSNSDHFRTSKLILVSEKVIPHSFLTYIFVNKDAYESGSIEKEILEHELVHISEKHAFDILFIEILKIIFWFNPVFYLYKNAIQLNHEFIADDRVARQTSSISAYQEILLRHAHSNPQFQFVSSFNYSLTKKRFIMMKKVSNNTIVGVKKGALIPLLALILMLFSNDSSGQSNSQFTLKDPTSLVSYLYIQPHPEKAKLALIEFKLNEAIETDLRIHDANKETSFKLLERNLEKGLHEITFDYSNLPEKNFDFEFLFHGGITISMNGAFMMDGKLQTIGDTLSTPTHETKIKN